MKRGWKKRDRSFSPGLSLSYGNCEITFGKAGAGTTICVEHNSLAGRTLRDDRSVFLEQVEQSDPDFSSLMGEGFANEILFPAGVSDKFFFITGDYLTTRPSRAPLTVTAYARVHDKVKRLWKATLVSGLQPGSGTLARYFRFRGWKLGMTPAGGGPDLKSRRGLAYESDNSGDGGRDLGFIAPSGRTKIDRQVMDRPTCITIPEERWIKAHPRSGKRSRA